MKSRDIDARCGHYGRGAIAAGILLWRDRAKGPRAPMRNRGSPVITAPGAMRKLHTVRARRCRESVVAPPQKIDCETRQLSTTAASQRSRSPCAVPSALQQACGGFSAPLKRERATTRPLPHSRTRTESTPRETAATSAAPSRGAPRSGSRASRSRNRSRRPIRRTRARASRA